MLDYSRLTKYGQTSYGKQLSKLLDKTQLDLAALDFIYPINCNLIFCLAETDIGIVAKDDQTYNCLLTLNGYQKIINLLEPFCSSENVGYQWLYDNNHPIDLLFLEDGSW